MPSNQISKQWWESKTIWVNVVTFTVSLLALFAADELFAPWAKYIVLGQAVLNLVLRMLTGQPIGNPTPQTTRWAFLATVSLAIPVALASTANAADSVIIVKDLSPGKHVLILNVDAAGNVSVERPPVVATIGDDGPIDPGTPPPPPAGDLEAAAKQALAEVPVHEQKEITAQALASIFREVGQQHADGNLPTEELFPTLDKAIDTVLSALGVSQHWVGFRTDIKAAINAEQLTPVEIGPAFEQISSGLSDDNEALIDIAPHVMALIQAIIAKDQAAVIQAVIQIVIALVGS